MKKTKAKEATAVIDAPLQPKAGEFRRVALDLIDPSPFQARKTFKTADWPDFVASVRTSGIVQPGVAREVNGRVELVCGERRFRASQEVGAPDMPLLIRDLTDAEAQEIVAIENLQREGLNDIEEAQGYADWIMRLTAPDETGLPQYDTRTGAIAHIENRIHRKKSVIYERLRLLELTEAEAAMLREGQISASVASLLPTIPDPKAREELREDMEEEISHGNTITFRSIADQIERDYSKPLKGALFKLDESYYDERGRELVACEKCPHRTGNMLDQFPELEKRPNVCTKPECYRQKVAIEADCELNKARSEGKTVLTEKEFKKRKSEFVPANQHVYTQGNSGTWESLMGKHKPEPVIVGTAEGLITVYPAEAAKAAAEKNGEKFYKEEKPMTPEDREKAQQEKERAKERRNKLVAESAPRLMQFIRKLTPKQAWELAYAELVDCYDRKNALLKGDSAQEKLLAHVFNRGTPVYHDGDWFSDWVKLWKRAGVDLLAEEKKVLAEEKKQADAPNEFVKEMLALAKRAGFRNIHDQFLAIGETATRAGLKDIDKCETEADRHALLEQFKTDYPACLGKTKPAKAKSPAKGTKAAKAKTKPAKAKGKKK